MRFRRAPSRIICLAAMAALVGLAGCAETEFAAQTAKHLSRVEPPRGAKIGRPYEINGVRYEPRADYAYDEEGKASWYGGHFHGRLTASGERFNMNALTAAHPTLPLPSIVQVTNLENGRSLELRVNDRGPFAEGRIIDVSRRAAELLDFKSQGVARVRVRVLAEQSLIAQGLDPSELRLASGAPAEEPVAVAAVAVPDPIPDAAAAGEPAVVPQPATAQPSPEAAAPTALVGYAPSGTWVQAGAFSAYPRADAVRSRLADVGPVIISTVRLGDADFYRVRVGPVETHAAAQEVLAQVVRAGYPESRIVME